MIKSLKNPENELKVRYSLLTWQNRGGRGSSKIQSKKKGPEITLSLIIDRFRGSEPRRKCCDQKTETKRGRGGLKEAITELS